LRRRRQCGWNHRWKCGWDHRWKCGWHYRSKGRFPRNDRSKTRRLYGCKRRGDHRLKRRGHSVGLTGGGGIASTPQSHSQTDRNDDGKDEEHTSSDEEPLEGYCSVGIILLCRGQNNLWVVQERVIHHQLRLIGYWQRYTLGMSTLEVIVIIRNYGVLGDVVRIVHCQQSPILTGDLRSTLRGS
jgi:hypothetical protein